MSKIQALKIHLRRFLHKRKRYAFPETQCGWEKGGRVLGDDKNIYFDPYVIYFNKKYYMFVSYRNNKSLVRFESNDGLNWNNEITLLLPDDNSVWENNVNRACVCIHNNLWYMWYTGMNNAESRIGLAVSKDGINFKRSLHNPVLLPELDFENKSVMNPCVLWDEQKNLFRMWYSAGEKYEPDVICYAESKDGIEWKKIQHPLFSRSENKYDCFKIGGCNIKMYNDKFDMYYIGYEDIDNARICLAHSIDGITWTRDEDNPIISPSINSWDADAVYKPSVIIEKNELILWYNGRSGNIENIGIAKKVLRTQEK